MFIVFCSFCSLVFIVVFVVVWCLLLFVAVVYLTGGRKVHRGSRGAEGGGGMGKGGFVVRAFPCLFVCLFLLFNCYSVDNQRL